MEKIVWNDRYNIGVGVVDQAHAKLFRVLSKLQAASEQPETHAHTYREGIKYLEAYTMTHFSEEEAYMRAIRYGNYARHKRIHDHFRDETLVSLKNDLELSDYSPASVGRFLTVMNHWLTGHIMQEDQAIAGKESGRRSRDLSSQLLTIAHAVNQYTEEIFQAEARLENSDYKGENIGTGFYCYQCFDIEGGIRLRLLIGAETLLILRGVNHLFGTQITDAGKLPARAVGRVFEHFFEDAGPLFRAKAQDEFDSSHLLTRDGFRADFMRGYPCRLLFETNHGNFIFCYRSWREINKKTSAFV